MVEYKEIRTPLEETVIKDLRMGDRVLLSGVVYTARDAAHERLVELIKEKAPLPFDLNGQVIYYAGPAPAKPGQVIGSAGPTTSVRMDSFTPLLLSLGLKGMIGKGPRGKEVVEAMVKHGAVYFAATGGAAALIARSVKGVKVVAYEDLGPEAIREMVVESLPLIVAIDAAGNNIYNEGWKKYAQD
jgi:fumarate hydratase subunit beta